VTAFNVLEFARKNKINKIIFSSSREIYGNSIDENSVTEDNVRIESCGNPYSASKVSAEALIHAYRKVYGLDFVIIRFSNVYGMYDDSDRVIPLWIRQALKNENLIFYGENKVLDFSYIDDSINGVMKIIEKFDNIKGETFNIAYGKGSRLIYVANKIRELLRSKSQIIIKENRLGEVCKFQADIFKAKKLLGYEPKIGIDEGLTKTVEWYKKFEKGM
jgi:UDP-glucose 4-epimerase